MAVREVSGEVLTYLVADDDLPADDLRWWSVLRTRVVDEITGKPPHLPITMRSGTRFCQPRTGSDGFCGLVARPCDVSSALVTAGALTAEVRVEGYLARPLTAAIDAARRRLLPPGAAAGDTSLFVAPPDPLPTETPPRKQFGPGRGVMLARPMPNLPDELNRVAEVSGLVAPERVPLGRPVHATRLPSTVVASVPVVLPDQPLHRASPTIVRGRALRQTAALAAPIPAPATSLGVSGVWWTLQEVTDHVPAHRPDLVGLTAPLSYDHAVGEAMDAATLTPDGVARSLRAVARTGTSEIVVSPWAGLSTTGGDYLLLEAAESQERELVITAPFVPPTTASGAATVGLRAPLVLPHVAETSVVLNTVTSIALTTVSREAQTGDRVLFGAAFPTTAASPADIIVHLAPTTATEELRFARRPPVAVGGAFFHPVTIAPDGTFALPPLARLAQVEILATHAGHPPLPFIHLALDPSGADNLQILFSP